MDGLKLDKWQENFLSKANEVRIQYDSYFYGKAFEDCFVLEIDELHQLISLDIIDVEMPNEIKDRLTFLLMETKPEDSV